jgi:Xaa-Pro aminopeptidase
MKKMLLNRARALEYMRAGGLDALVITSPANVTYFTDYRCWLDPLFREYMSAPGAPAHRTPTYALFMADGEPALVVSPLFAVNAADCWVSDVRIYGDPGVDTTGAPASAPAGWERFFDLLRARPQTMDAHAALAQLLIERGLAGGRIGVEMDELSHPAMLALRRGLPAARLLDCSNLLRLIRMVKTPAEIDRLERAAAIAENAAAESLRLARPGRPMGEVTARFRTAVAEAGADMDHFAFGPRGLGIAAEPQYAPAADEVMYVDFGCIYGGYFSDAGLTLALGEPPALLQARYAALVESVEAGASAMQAGVRASRVQAAMWQVMVARGFTACYPHGHGVGLEVRDYPILAPDNGLRIRDDCVDVPSDLPLEAAMVLSLEAGMFLPGVGSLQVERGFVVTSHGSRPLTPQDRGAMLRPAG